VLITNTKTERLDVAGFSEPNFKVGLIDSLVLREERKTMIKNLVKISLRRQGLENLNQQEPLHWYSDQVHGKGEGLIFLLHGKPGVGKTFTAGMSRGWFISRLLTITTECIAEHTKRPLLTLTCADLGTDPSNMEIKLQEWFKIAQHWDCILLIDEADVYMENRETSDLERNNLVASFLRVMEYFQGIL